MESNTLFSNLNEIYLGWLPESLSWAAYLGTGFTIILILVNALLMLTAFGTYMERRVLGRFQTRLGPNRVGPFGLLQPLADLLKLIIKEDLRPVTADRLTFFLAPVLMVTSMLVVVAVVPFGNGSFLADLNIGVLYLVGIPTIATVSIFLGGWGSGNRFALLGAARAVAMLISYEVPVVLCLLGVVMVAGSMSLSAVVAAQQVPFLLVQPLALFVFLAGTSAELNRTPFDVAEAESELIAGFHIEYSGVKFALIQTAEIGAVLVAAAVTATLFLSGWSGPASSYLGWLWFAMKVGAVAFMFVWVRATFPRLRIDQLMALAWKFLLPLSIINLFATSLEVYFFRSDQGVLSPNDLWVMAGINLALALGSIALFGGLIRNKVKPPVAGIPAGVVAPATMIEVR